MDLPGYGYAAAPEAERRTWAPLIDALRERESLRGLVLIVDSRRGVSPKTRISSRGRWADGNPMPFTCCCRSPTSSTRNEANKALREARAVLAG